MSFAFAFCKQGAVSIGRQSFTHPFGCTYLCFKSILKGHSQINQNEHHEECTKNLHGDFCRAP
eukprot:5391685-Amphidinium_carterae.2